MSTTAINFLRMSKRIGLKAFSALLDLSFETILLCLWEGRGKDGKEISFNVQKMMLKYEDEQEYFSKLAVLKRRLLLCDFFFKNLWNNVQLILEQ